MLARRALAAVVLVLCTSCAPTATAPAVDADRLGLSAVAVYGRHAAVRGNWARDDSSRPPRLRTTLQAERRASGHVEVTQLSRNILFGVDVPEQEPLLALDAHESSDEVDVVLTATRCDPHALTESKTSFTFPLFARAAGGEDVATAVTATGAGRDALQALLDDTCTPS